jgi:hypothetical protein
VIKASLKISALCAVAAAGMAAPVAAYAAGSCNDQHATCLQGGGSEDRCLAAWHQCRSGGLKPIAYRPPAPAQSTTPAAKPVKTIARR